MTKRLRIGSVPYLVGRPLDLGLEDEEAVDFVREVPAQLVEGLRSGRLDVALVSSIELFRRPGYRWIEGLGVQGAGFVGSVNVFLRKPLARVESVALDPSSRTAQALTRMLLRGDRGPAPEFIEIAADQDPREVEADAWLRIGDRALRELHAEDTGCTVFNPSEAWARETGLPFVFAPWIVAPGVEVDERFDALIRARERGRNELARLAQEAARAWGLALDACRYYLEVECAYEGGAEMERALFAFGERAARLDLAEDFHAPEDAPRPVSLPPRPCPG